ncbi:hypothetical protein BOTBODRAFT_71761, partial [Botryobasidium botryosum FD-172 SS1]
ALDHLEHLVVQRLFELQRLGLSETGYKMRKHIAQALKKRSNAVKSALTAYNNAARNLVPPRPTYEWEALSHYGFLQDCILLRESSPDILSKRWSQPAIRVLMKQHLRVRRAREEIVRCNIEIRRLHTFIVDENSSLQKTLGGLQDSGDIWFGPFQEYCMFRRRVNDCILARIAQTYQLAGFTG